jgi:hypothetical protein
MAAAPTRYAPRRPFPPYAFLPGRDPHPTRDPAGHSYGGEEHAGPYFAASDWRANELYLYGVDLYNHGYLWEAHEAWETLWHAAKRDVPQAEQLQGLIQCAAACLKIPMGQPRGLERLAELGCARLERVAQAIAPRRRALGLELAPFARALRAFAASQPASNDARPRIVLEDD